MISYQSDLQSLFLTVKKEKTLLLSRTPFLFFCSLKSSWSVRKDLNSHIIFQGLDAEMSSVYLECLNISTVGLGLEVVCSFSELNEVVGFTFIYSYHDMAINLHPTTLLLLPLNFADFLIGWFVQCSCPIKEDNFCLGQAGESVHITFHWQSVAQLALHQSQMEHAFLGSRVDAVQWLMRTLIISCLCVGKGRKLLNDKRPDWALK